MQTYIMIEIRFLTWDVEKSRKWIVFLCTWKLLVTITMEFIKHQRPSWSSRSDFYKIKLVKSNDTLSFHCSLYSNFQILRNLIWTCSEWKSFCCCCFLYFGFFFFVLVRVPSRYKKKENVSMTLGFISLRNKFPKGMGNLKELLVQFLKRFSFVIPMRVNMFIRSWAFVHFYLNFFKDITIFFP